MGEPLLHAGASNEDEYGGVVPWIYRNDYQQMVRACRPGLCAACKAAWENKDRPPRGGGGGPSEAGPRRALGGGPSEAGSRRAPGGGPSNF